MSKQELIDQVAQSTGHTKKDVAATLDGLLDQVERSLEKGNNVTITGFGTFEVRERKARDGVKPGTSERIKIPASKYPAFKAGKGLKDAVK